AYLPMLAGAAATLEPGQRELLGLPTFRAAAWPVLVSTRTLLAAFRLSTGVSPSLQVARRRVAAAPVAPTRAAAGEARR
ncbi:MAG: hypothetical protein M3O86_02000, partial [Actinomycetota bacterium]|nr:hypothetical protein [Actinomycetota bacterium]